MLKFLIAMERTSADLDLRPMVIEGYVNSAIREEDEYLQDFERAKKKFDEGDLVGCRNDCIDLMTSPGASLILRSRARILFASNPTLTIDERQPVLHRAMETLRALHQGSASGGSSILANWEAEGEKVQRQIDEAAAEAEEDLIQFT